MKKILLVLFFIALAFYLGRVSKTTPSPQELKTPIISQKPCNPQSTKPIAVSVQQESADNKKQVAPTPQAGPDIPRGHWKNEENDRKVSIKIYHEKGESILDYKFFVPGVINVSASGALIKNLVKKDSNAIIQLAKNVRFIVRTHDSEGIWGDIESRETPEHPWTFIESLAVTQ